MCCAHHLIIKTSNDLSTFTFTYEHLNMQHYVWCLKLLFPPYHQQINFTPPPPTPTYTHKTTPTNQGSLLTLETNIW